MRTHLLLGAIGICAVIGTFQSTDGTSSATASSRGLLHSLDRPQPITQPSEATPAAAPRRPFGHLILQIEGDANGLRVTWITPKQSAYNPSTRTSPYRIELLDADGMVAGVYPLDLSQFDMNPARVGKPLRVQGCEIRDTRVATIANVAFLAGATAARIMRGNRQLGSLDSTTYQRLLKQGEVR